MTKINGGKNKRVQYEVDFVVNRGSQRYYIQSAFAILDEEKRKQEILPPAQLEIFRRFSDRGVNRVGFFRAYLE